MPHLPSPAELTPVQRRREIAEILARGVLRLSVARGTPCAPPVRPGKEEPESSGRSA